MHISASGHVQRISCNFSQLSQGVRCGTCLPCQGSFAEHEKRKQRQCPMCKQCPSFLIKQDSGRAGEKTTSLTFKCVKEENLIYVQVHSYFYADVTNWKKSQWGKFWHKSYGKPTHPQTTLLPLSTLR